MFSVTKTGMNLRPLCTAKVCPTNSGIIVERRDQVLITFFWLVRIISSTFLARCRSTKGPFLIDRAIFLLLAAHSGAPRTDDEFVGSLVLSRGESLGLLSPGRDGMGIALPRLALAAPVGVIDGVHRQAAHGRSDSKPTASACLPEADDFVVDVAQLPHRRAAVDQDFAHRPRGQPHLGVVPLLGHQLSPGAGGPNQLTPATGLELEVVNHRADRDVLQREAVSWADVRRRATEEGVAHHQPDGSEDVALLTIGVVQQRDVSGAV